MHADPSGDLGDTSDKNNMVVGITVPIIVGFLALAIVITAISVTVYCKHKRPDRDTKMVSSNQ